jgi:hypothetical protein
LAHVIKKSSLNSLQFGQKVGIRGGTNMEKRSFFCNFQFFFFRNKLEP